MHKYSHDVTGGTMSMHAGRLVAPIALAVVALATGTAPAQAQQYPDCGPAPAGTTQSFGPLPFDLFRPQPFRVPDGVTRLEVAAVGGHGGQFKSTGLGGPAGGVDATVPVTPGECLTVLIGKFGFGNGGAGWGPGGKHGTADGPESDGHAGGGGGGATAVVRGREALVIAGGGGGAGGDAQHATSQGGGYGGAGGSPAQIGQGGRGKGGAPGCGGCRPGHGGSNGTSQDDDLYDFGAGGGGGGGLRGGGGGGAEYPGGGGGGGGGSSAVPVADAGGVTFFTSTLPCPVRNVYQAATCNGAVTLRWVALAASARPVVRVIDARRSAVLDSGVRVHVGPGDVPVALELSHPRAGVGERRTLEAQRTGPTRLSLALSPRMRRLVRRADLTHFKLRMTHGGRSTSQTLRVM